MDSIKVYAESKEYPIYFSEGFEGLLQACEETQLSKSKAFIITDSNVGKIYLEEVETQLKKYFAEVESIVFEAGERNKNIYTISELYSGLLEKRAERKSVVFALGGGVCGDMAGFAAATYLRGIKFVQIPTSLLAQVDSSVGGKVGIDFKHSKNMIGAFYQPEYVYVNINTLKTLPEREFRAGIAEVIKYGPIYSPAFYDYVWENKESIKALEPKYLQEIIKKSCEIKADVVSKDEKESGLREILNFGHTIGHAVESVMDFKLLHGECVAVGMSAAMEISSKRGYISKFEAELFRELLKFFGLELTVEGTDVERVYKQMFLDKKVKNNKISFVLIKKFGETLRTDDVSEEEIKEAVNYILR